MFEMLIKNPWMPIAGSLKLRVHMASLDWNTKKISVMYELITAQEMIMSTGIKELTFTSVKNLSEDSLHESLVRLMGFELVEATQG